MCTKIMHIIQNRGFGGVDPNLLCKTPLNDISFKRSLKQCFKNYIKDIILKIINFSFIEN